MEPVKSVAKIIYYYTEKIFEILLDPMTTVYYNVYNSANVRWTSNNLFEALSLYMYRVT